MCVITSGRETKTNLLFTSTRFKDIQNERKRLPHKIQPSEAIQKSLDLGFENHEATPKRATEKTCPLKFPNEKIEQTFKYNILNFISIQVLSQ